MRGSRPTALLLAALPLTAPRPPAAPVQPPIAHVYVDVETRVAADVTASVDGGELRAPAPDSARGAVLARRTPFVLELHGPVRELRLRSRPEQPVRVRIAVPGARGAPAVHRGWTFRFRRDGDRFAPVVQSLPVPPGPRPAGAPGAPGA